MSRDLQIAYAVGAALALLGNLRQAYATKRGGGAAVLVGYLVGAVLTTIGWPLFAGIWLASNKAEDEVGRGGRA